MGLMDDWSLYTVTTRSITVWNINIVTQFWAVTRSKAKVMRLHGAEGKSKRLAVQSEDGRFVLRHYVFRRATWSKLNTPKNGVEGNGSFY